MRYKCPCCKLVCINVMPVSLQLCPYCSSPMFPDEEIIDCGRFQLKIVTGVT